MHLLLSQNVSLFFFDWQWILEIRLYSALASNNGYRSHVRYYRQFDLYTVMCYQFFYTVFSDGFYFTFCPEKILFVYGHWILHVLNYGSDVNRADRYC